MHNWILDAGWEADAGCAAMGSLLAQSSRPTAIVAASVNAGLGAHGEMLRRGLRIPEDVSLIGIQDSWMARIVQPELTVVRMPLREAGERAARMLIECLNDRALHHLVIRDPAPDLIVRGTTRRLH